uniref:Cytochrome c domain-containing protein n=1 Tax=Parastrongyloides trichosuri TaxID=131310 RepID=A0A0N4ZXK8_PARTI
MAQEVENINGTIKIEEGIKVEEMDCDECHILGGETSLNNSNDVEEDYDCDSKHTLENMMENKSYVFDMLKKIRQEDIKNVTSFPAFVNRYAEIINGITFMKYDNIEYVLQAAADKEKFDNHEVVIRNELLNHEKRCLEEELETFDRVNNDAFKLYKTLIKELDLDNDNIIIKEDLSPHTFTAETLISILNKHCEERTGASESLEISQNYLQTLKSVYDGRIAGNADKKAINCQMKSLLRSYSKTLKVTSKEK